MYVRIYVEAPEASKTVSLSLSLFADCVCMYWAGGPGHTCLLTTHHKGLKQRSVCTEVVVQDMKESCYVEKIRQPKIAVQEGFFRVELRGDSTTYRNRTIALVGSLPCRL